MDQSVNDTDIVLSAIRRGEDSLPKLRTATGLEYAQLHPVLHKLEFEWRSIDSSETAEGFKRFTPTSSEKSNGGSKGTLAPITPQAFKDTKASVSARDATLYQRDAPYCIECRSLCLFDGLDAENRTRWRCKTCSLTFEGSSGQVVEMAHIDPHEEAKAKIAAMVERGRAPRRAEPADNGHEAPRAPHPLQGPAYKPLDLAEVEEIMATEETIAKGAAKLGLTNMQLYTRRRRDKAVEDAVQRGRDRFYESEESETIRPDDETIAPLSDTITPASETSDAVSDAPQTEKAKALPENPQESPQIITETITNNGTSRETETEQPERAQQVNADISEDKIGASNTANKISAIPTSAGIASFSNSDETQKQTTAKERDVIPELSGQDTQMVTRTSEIHGSLVLREEVQVKVEEIAQWPPERIAEFFDAISKVVNIPKRTFPTTIKRAWSKSFEDDNEEGMPALTMLYLISMLHEGMEEHEKQAVWVLVLYCKRVQAAAEAAREAKKGEQQ